MEALDSFLSTIDKDFDWEAFVTPPELEEAFQEVITEDYVKENESGKGKENEHPAKRAKKPSERFAPVIAEDYVKQNESDKGKENEHPAKRAKKPSERFAPSVNSDDIQKMSTPFVPANTTTSTQWAIRNFQEWTESHNASNPEMCRKDLLETCNDPEELSKWLSTYVMATRKGDGEKYTPKTINCLLAGILRHIRRTNPFCDSLNFMDPKSKDFKAFRSLLDRVFRQLRSEGIGANPKSATIITDEDEDILWEKGVLGIDSPEALLYSVFFYNGKNFHLRGGQEHRFLCISQLQRLSNPARYVYVENGSKNRSGGLNDRFTNKVVPIYSNPSSGNRDHVFLLDNYLSKIPQAARQLDIFYLRPVSLDSELVTTTDIWYGKQPVGRNTLQKMTKTIFEKAGILDRHVTNHSLRATGTTKLFTAGVPEKIIKERTGHKSLEALRCYERTTEDQIQAVSNILAPSTSSSFPAEMGKFKQTNKRQDSSRDKQCNTPVKWSKKPRMNPSYMFQGCTVTFVQKVSLDEDNDGFDDLIKENMDQIP